MSSMVIYLIALTAAFVTLDLAGKIDWTWWQLTLPILFALGFGLLGVFVRAFSTTKTNIKR